MKSMKTLYRNALEQLEYCRRHCPEFYAKFYNVVLAYEAEMCYRKYGCTVVLWS